MEKRIWLLQILLIIAILLSPSMYALDSSQENILEDNYEKLTPETYETLMDASGTEEYTFLIEYADTASALTHAVSLSDTDVLDETVYEADAVVDDVVTLLNQDYIKYIELEQQTSSFSDTIGYNINKTAAPVVWGNTTGVGVKVAILDTGIASHADLVITGGTSIISADYNDNNGHGTAVAGVVAATLNDAGIAGVAPDVDLYAVKIMETASGNLSDAITGLQWAIDNNMSIVVMSFGFDGFSNIFRDKVATFYNNGGLLVAAAGNDGGTTVKYPAKYSKVIAVGATDENDVKASFSPSSVDIELVASGVSVTTTILNEGYAPVSGTSFSAPAVAGVAALIWELDPSLNNTELRTKLHEDALDLGEVGKDQSYGYGLVRVNESIGVYEPYLDSYYYEVNKWFENGTQEEYVSGYGVFDEETYEDGRYLLIRRYVDGTRVYEELQVVGEYQGISALAVQNTTITATDDAYINSSSADTNYGSNTQLINWESGANQVWSYLQYSLGSLPSTVSILDADIVLYVTETPASDTFSLNNVDSSWSEATITWNNKPSTVGGSLMTPTITSSDDETDFVMGDGDVTSAVSTDLSNNRNASFQIESGASTAAIFKSSEATTSSQRPRLIVYYNNPNLDCNGTMQVQAVDANDAPMSGLYVRANNQNNGTTDSLGLKNLNFNPATCNLRQNVSVYCSDNTTFCGNWSETFTANGQHDFRSHEFVCSMCLQRPELEIGLGDVNITKRGLIDDSINYNVTLVVHSENTNQNNVKVTFRYQNQNGITERETNFTVNVNPYTDYTFSEAASLNNITYIHFYVDTTDIVRNETSETNNYVLYPIIRNKPKVSIDVHTGYSEVDQAIINYLELFVINTSQSAADVVIEIENSKKNPTIQNSLNAQTRNKQLFVRSETWEHRDGKVYYNGNRIPGDKPYTGLVGGFLAAPTVPPLNGSKYIVVYGDGIEGTIAAVKKLVNARALFFTNYGIGRVAIIDQYDTTGIGVFDVLHNPTNEPVFGDNTDDFGDAVERVLNDNTFELEILTVKEPIQNTTLRIKHENSDYSAGFVNATTQSQQPVVLAHGIHSDLNTWEAFAEDLVEVGFDTWIIEPYGGPTTECSTCPVYTVANLTKNYWPALITGVQNYSGQDNLSYVGYDLGCTVALESLELYEQGKTNAGYVYNTQTGQYVLDSMSSRPIDTFVGLGCIGNFSPSDDYNPKKLPLFATQVNITNYSAFPISTLYGGHIPGYWYKANDYIIGTVGTEPIEGTASYSIKLLSYLGVATKVANIASKISVIINVVTLPVGLIAESRSTYLPPATSNGLSKGVYEDLQEWMRNGSGPIIGKNVNFTNAAIIQARQTQKNVGKIKLFEILTVQEYDLYDKGTDGFVSTKDEKEICQNINSNNKYYVEFTDLYHFSSLTKSGLDKDENVKNTIITYLRDNSLNNNSVRTVLATNQGCE